MAGVVIGILVLVAIVFVTCYCCIKRRKKSSGSVLRTPSKDHNQMAASKELGGGGMWVAWLNSSTMYLCMIHYLFNILLKQFLVHLSRSC